MTNHSTDRIRNVALLGQSGVGKTTLAEALLVKAGVIPRAGRVDDGTSLLDTEPEETKRRISLSLTVAPLEWTGNDGQPCRINLIDCPGYPDFGAEAEAAMAVVDLAVFVVSAVEGVEVQTELLWRRAAERGLPRMVFVNKEDKDRADFHRVVKELKSVLSGSFVPLELPLGEADALHGIADVLSEEAYDYEPDGTKRVASMPDEVIDEEHRLHDQLVEEIVTGDDEQMERYLSGETLTVAQLERTLAREVLACAEFPVLVGSALTGVGVDRLADFICDLGPSPADRPVDVSAGDTTIKVDADASAKPLLYVFKTVADPYVGQLSVFKVLSGTIAADDHLVNTRNSVDERLHGLFHLRGKEQAATSSLVAGDIGAVAKLSATRTNDTLAPKGMPVKIAAAPAITPQFGVAIVPRTQADDDKLGNALQRLQAEDPAITVERQEATQQTILRGMGDTHIAVTLERLARKFGVNVDIADQRVAYCETVTGRAGVEGKVKKQSGGHGQFAVVNLRISPLPRGDGFQFTDSVVGGAIPRNYIPAVQRGIEEAMTHGGVYGFPVVDVHVDCHDGRYHAVDSSEMAFRTAAAHGFKQGIAAAGVVVLEPVSLLQVTVPIAYQGDVMADVTARRGRLQGTTAVDNGEQMVIAHVPTSELLRYTIDLRSMTSGRGRFTAEHDHYDVLPAHLVDKVKQSAQKH